MMSVIRSTTRHSALHSQQALQPLTPFLFRAIKKSLLLPLFLIGILCHAQTVKKNPEKKQLSRIYKDVPFVQDYSIKYNSLESGTEFYKVYADRNGVIKIFSSDGLMQPFGGEMLYPGTIVKDETYRPVAARKISGISYIKSNLFL